LRPDRTPTDLAAQYGPWAIVAGAALGIGEAFATRLARAGLNLVLVDRTPDPLEGLCRRLAEAHGVITQPLVLDLAEADAAETVARATSDLYVGLLVYNAAHSPIGRVLDLPLPDLLRVVDVNMRTPLLLAQAFGRPMAERGRGGIVLMSSLSALQGSAYVAAYAASKAFTLVLGEGLWEELRGHGVDVVTCVAGPTRTPGYLSSAPAATAWPQPPVMAPDDVAAAARAALGQTPMVIPGALNRAVAFVTSRLLPRAASIRLFGRTLERMYGGRSPR
jgi:hypothetical protein